MNLVLTLLVGVARALVSVLELGLFLRAIRSFFAVREDNPVLEIACMITEPVIMPFRALFEKKGWFEDTPIDMAFLVAALTLSIIEAPASEKSWKRTFRSRRGNGSFSADTARRSAPGCFSCPIMQGKKRCGKFSWRNPFPKHCAQFL